VREKGSRGKRKGGNPSSCADVLEGTLQGLGLGRVTRHLALLKAWDRAIAPRIRERASVEDFREGRLYLCVEDPIWLHELHMLRHKLKIMLNEEVGEAVVGEIVLRIGRTARRASARMPNPPLQRPARADLSEMEARIEQLLRPLEDVPCRDALKRLFDRWAARSI